ncbi:MAG: hypothetical protein K8J09_21085 [Planctomycetes bacterium]|nr:hypothetical protein [Planctomycetota bacterium]
MKTKFLSLLAASFLFAACGKDEHVHTPGDGHGKEAGHTDDHGGGGHGAMVSLGSIQLDGVAVEVEQEGAVEAGKEVGVEISFAKDKPLVETVRAWVGVESAAGSMKGKLMKEGDTALHGHLEVPKPLPEGSRIWFEVDGASAGKASIGFRK